MENEDGGLNFFPTLLESHVCSAEELGLSGRDHKFWPVSRSQETFLKAAKDQLLCVDQSDLSL